VTALYAHFNVCSRAELLAYFIRRRPVPREDDDRRGPEDAGTAAEKGKEKVRK
jgi:hypothetical protein